ncbi:hypothetical protein [Actinomadura chibensis]|uniref:Uncharacterized protein n=1 Tax=Actinomadura chibensis TaxID=392828 RepID=A0A5D0NJH1_9ACTN|nr:hypothetical protein [Actinomadura chibensis]TYB44542.1 hypothetical protein FXF69_20495 [Actinomadura chibensis]
MSEHPGDALTEAARLVDALIKRVGGGPGTAPDGARGPGAEPWASAAGHLRDAGRSLLAAALDVAAAFDRPSPGGRDGPAEASEQARAGTSERSGRPETGEPWSAATGGGPIDIG